MIVIVSAVAGALFSGIIQFILNFREKELKAKSIEAAFYGEITSLLYLIEKREYIKSLETGKNVILYLQKTKVINNAVFEPFLIVHSDKFWNIYLTNSEHIGSVKPHITQDIIKFYNLIFGLLEDATYAGETVKKVTEHFQDDELGLFMKRLEAMDIVYTADIKLLKDAIVIGKRVCNNLKLEIEKPWYKLYKKCSI